MWGARMTTMIAWVAVLVLAALYAFPFAHSLLFWLLLGLVTAMSPVSVKMWDAVRTKTAMAIFSVVFLIGSVANISGLWLLGQRFVGEMAYAKAVSAFREGKDATSVRSSLERAITLNPWEDAYQRNLSQAYILEATQAAKGPADEDRAKKVDGLIRAGVEAALVATRLAPVNVDNWSNLASIYTSIAPFTRGADEFAIKNFEEALLREPNNPVFLNEIGRLHVLRADAYATLLSSKEEKARTDAAASVKVELAAAEQAFQKAITAKSDYAPAHYHLGIVYEREGRLGDSIRKLEQVLTANNKDVGLGFQLATLYYRNKDKDKALDLLEQVVALDPQYANAHWYLSVLYEERGRYDDAIAQVKKVQETNPNEAVVKERLERLIAARAAETRPTAPTVLPEPLSTSPQP
jgi:tetratricopeptide (TPR) repeat protein